MRPLLSLEMILKNEAASIKDVLLAVKPFVDQWTILDTGSTDGTQDIVNEVLADLPGALHEEPFVDFATSRNRVLELAAQKESPAVFSLMLSGDEYLRGGEALRSYLTQQIDSGIDAHRLNVVLDNTRMLSPRILRTGSAWKYEGEIHEFPANRDQQDAPVANVPASAFIEHIVSDAERRLSNIWENHIPMLTDKLNLDPENPRTLVFLAASYETLLPHAHPGERVTFAMIAMSMLLRRMSLPFETDAERNYIKMRFLDDASYTGLYTPTELLARAVELTENDPQRPETALLCARIAKAVPNFPVKQFYDLANRAAEIAYAAKSIESASPVSMDCGWKANYYAAAAAKMLCKQDFDTYAPIMRRHVSAGLAEGGAYELFKAIADDGTTPAPVTVELSTSTDAQQTDSQPS